MVLLFFVDDLNPDNIDSHVLSLQDINSAKVNRAGIRPKGPIVFGDPALNRVAAQSTFMGIRGAVDDGRSR